MTKTFIQTYSSKNTNPLIKIEKIILKDLDKNVGIYFKCKSLTDIKDLNMNIIVKIAGKIPIYRIKLNHDEFKIFHPINKNTIFCKEIVYDLNISVINIFKPWLYVKFYDSKKLLNDIIIKLNI